MDILLTGGTGLIGSSTLRLLLDRGHHVTAAVRSETSARRVADAGATPLVGDLTDEAWTAQALAGVDAAVHLAADDTGAALDAAVARAAVKTFAGTGRPYVHTSGVWVYGSGADLTEDTPLDPPAITAWRLGVADLLADSDLAWSIVAPAIVYGHGAGIPNVVSGAPRTDDGALVLVGGGDQHWTTVHVDDLAALYAVVVERVASTGDGVGYVIGANGQNPTVRELGLAAAHGGAVVPDAVDATRERLGAAFADALLLDQQADGAKARSLGWEPVGPSLVDELASGSYAG